MNQLLSAAGNIARDFAEGKLNAVEAELELLNLGFHSITFPRRGALIRAFYLSTPYEL